MHRYYGANPQAAPMFWSILTGAPGVCTVVVLGVLYAARELKLSSDEELGAFVRRIFTIIVASALVSAGINQWLVKPLTGENGPYVAACVGVGAVVFAIVAWSSRWRSSARGDP